MQNDLADALRILGERGDDAALKDAVAAYLAALEVFTRSAYPAYFKFVSNKLAGTEALIAKRAHQSP
jgi:hypothetical protein